MNKDFSELVEYLDGKFVSVDKRFESIDKRFDEVNARIDKVEEKFDKKFDQLLTAIDKLTNSIEIYHQEQVAIKAKMDIHEKWIFQLADKLGLKLQE
jgi:flagellar capping protein FliD